jgi:hypothetical protein
LYTQFRLKSFYRITHKNMNINILTNTTNMQTLGVSLQSFIFLLLFFQLWGDRSKNTDSETVRKKNNHTISIFSLPSKKKSVIFLRAPYKNKLARLNIVNLEYTLLISINELYSKTTQSKKTTHLTNVPKYIYGLGSYNMSGAKIKHAQTKISVVGENLLNFTLASYL